MRTVELILDDETCSGSAELGASLCDFLVGLGLEVEGLLFDQQGKPVSPRYTLAHSAHGMRLTQRGEIGPEVPALTLDEILTTTV